MINESLKNAFKEMWKKNLNLLDIAKSDLNSHTHNYAGSPYAVGPAYFLKTTRSNEINFKGLTDQRSVYFNSRNADTGEYANTTSDLITGYYLHGVNKDRNKIKHFTPGGKELECKYEPNGNN